PLPPKTPEALSVDFGSSVFLIRSGARVDRWRQALEMLEADPIFRDAEVATLARDGIEEDVIKLEARRLFRNLSSGHKIVLLTITRLVETVEEKTLVLLDEPEAHLHPPLLSAFVRSLSDLLINRNGVAVIATHSPVVLQEVPKNCVWKISRSGARIVAERPDIETFGENVGILTREIFGLEVTHSGFHKMLHDAVAEKRNYNAVIRHFDGELGGEARAIVRGLLAVQTHVDEGNL
ncbi:MAG: ATP-binding protein, partial [Magnetococcus sp. YQC-5]